MRLGAVPVLFALNAGSGDASHTTLAATSAILAILSLVLTVLPFTETSTTMGDTLVEAGTVISMSILDALLPLCLLRACHVPTQTASGTRSLIVGEKSDITNLPLAMKLRLNSHIFWGTLRQASLLSIVVIAPIFLFCGEVQAIRDNSYVLNITFLWYESITSGLLTGVLLILLSILARTNSPVGATFISIPSSAVQFLVFAVGSLPLLGYSGVVLCLVSSAVFLGIQPKDNASGTINTKRSIATFVRNIAVAGIICTCIYAISQAYQPMLRSQNDDSSCYIGGDLDDGGVASHPPLALSSEHDGYLGDRPAADSIANIDLIIERCGEVANGIGVDDVVRCLSFLKDGESEYLSFPNISTHSLDERASGTPKIIDPLGKPSPSVAEHPPALSAQMTTTETCPGPVIPFHVYWTGPATWRFEFFVKAYLYTQNLPCSRLYLWLDSDLDASAVSSMLCSDPIFQRFRPLVQRGDIVLKAWNFPHRIPIPTETAAKSSGLYFAPRPTSNENETALADNLVRDAEGQHWLTLRPAHAAFSPVQVSDAVRFIILHLHGGVYCDMDVLLLRDMRPLLLPDPVTGEGRAFAEQWVERSGPGDYNTAVISLPANSSLSTYLLHGGIRMGMNFHPRVIGRMAWRDGRNGELAMLHNAVFDPLVTNLRREGSESCTVPCHKNFESSFMRVVDEPWDEWKAFDGEQVEDVVGMYPPTNRTLGTWFRGAWAYHIHNQVYRYRLEREVGLLT